MPYLKKMASKNSAVIYERSGQKTDSQIYFNKKKKLTKNFKCCLAKTS